MGHSIAHVFALAGIEVNLVDLNEAALEHAMDLMRGNLETLAEFKKYIGRRYTGDSWPYSYDH